MDLLPLLLTILAAGVAIGGITWYLLKHPRTTKKRPKAKRPRRNEQSIDKIAAATKKNLTKAKTVEEAFATGRKGLDKIKRQIKDSKPPKRSKK